MPAQEKNKGTRFLPVGSIRTLEGEGNERSFQISFSSEEPYNRYFGPEILAHNGMAVDLSRLNELGVLLFNHNRDRVLGKVTRAWLENDRGLAEIEFDTDADAEIIFQKVKNGTLRGISVGYIVRSWEEVSADKVSADGRFQGPCSIARDWMPYEISIVSVPADGTVGVGRELDNEETHKPDISRYVRQVEVNQNYWRYTNDNS